MVLWPALRPESSGSGGFWNMKATQNKTMEFHGFFGMPGMAYILMVKVHRGDYHRSGQPLVEHQGCLPWGRIWRKVKTKLRPDEKKPQVRPVRVGWVCRTTRNPIDCGILLQVNAAGMQWRRYDLTPGDLMSGSSVIVTTNHEKSAEPIVVKKCM